jgi:hypothetical protein
MAELISKDKQYRTRDGREVRIYATDGKYPFVVQGDVKTEHGEWEQVSWTTDGSLMLENGCHKDLIEVRPRHKRTVWLNVYPNAVISTEDGPLRYEASLLACIKVDLDFEEGEGL